MKALVTGSAGFIGSHLVDRLLEMNIEVIGVDNRSSGNWQNTRIIDYHVDITTERLRDIFRDIRPNVVFHLAAAKKVDCLDNPMHNLEVNALGTLNVLKLAHEYNAQKFIYASTGSVYGLPVFYPQTELHPTYPLSPYGIAKLTAEGFCKFYQTQELDVTILRYFHVYGPRQRCQDSNGGVVGIFCRRVLEGLPLVIHNDGNQIRSFTYVEDIVNANIYAMSEKASGEIYNVASGLQVSINELANKIIMLNGSGARYCQGKRQFDISDWQISNDKIKSIGMKEWMQFDDGIAETFEWYKNG